jgi:hypothetical protein
MEYLKGLSTSRKLILGGGLLLFIDTFLPWQKASASFGGFHVSATRNAWHGFWGVLLGLLTIAILAWAVVRLLGVALPPGIPQGLTTLGLGALILLFAVLKALTESYKGWASWIGIVLAAGVAAGAWLAFQESGEALPRMPQTTAGGGSPPAPPAPPSAPATPAPTPPADEESSSTAGSDEV